MEDELKFRFNPYRRHFKRPLQTSHGTWRVREGIIICLEDKSGVVSRGEIAPLPWFGSETMAEALDFCRYLGDTISSHDIAAIPDRLPCCQFALKSACLDLARDSKKESVNELDFCYLLPPGESALTAWQEVYRTQAVTTFKLKIGVLPLATEIEIIQQLSNIIPQNAKLRLDANGGLNLQQAKHLLSFADTSKKIEFIEQPLPPEGLADIWQLSQDYTTPIALDESVASFQQLKEIHALNWSGVYVIKAAIMGFPDRLMEFCQTNNLDVVFSSVFETKVGRHTVLNMARSLYCSRAVGFGVQSFYQVSTISDRLTRQNYDRDRRNMKPKRYLKPP